LDILQLKQFKDETMNNYNLLSQRRKYPVCKFIILSISLCYGSVLNQEGNPDFPRKKVLSAPELMIPSNDTLKPGNENHHEKMTNPGAPNRVELPWEELISNHIEISSCPRMEICLEMFYVNSLIGARNRKILESSLKHVLTDGKHYLPFGIDITNVEISDQIIQGRRLMSKIDRNRQKYPILVCFSLIGEYQSKKYVDCEIILRTFISHYYESFHEELLETLKRSSSDNYFQDIDSLNVISSLRESPIAAITYAAKEQDMAISKENGNSDTAIITFVIIISAGLVLLAFVSFMLMHRQSKKYKTYEIDFESDLGSNYPEEVTISTSKNVKSQSQLNLIPFRTDYEASFSKDRSPTFPRHPVLQNTSGEKIPSVIQKSNAEFVLKQEEPFEERSECFAPPGKLGVAIDSMNGKPVVHRIKSGSPLEGILVHRDKIVGIDNIDTSSMTAAEVTRLMISKMNKTRKISFVRNKESSKRNGVS